MNKPTKNEILDVLDQMYADLAEMIGRWGGKLTPQGRAELREICRPGLEILIKAQRRGQTRNPVPRPRRPVKDLLPPD